MNVKKEKVEGKRREDRNNGEIGSEFGLISFLLD